MSTIVLESVSAQYGRHKALSDVSLTIDGGAVGLLGPNGAGKTTLMKILLGFLKPVRGNVSIFGLSMPKHAIEVRGRLGYMPEREVVSPNVSAVSFLSYCGALCGMSHTDARERTHEVLNFVGLGDNRYRKMDTYSTGMLQRVKFAAALIHDPKVLLLDEPTNGLDPDGRTEMLDLIRGLPRERDITVILSSHLLPDVEYVCDRLIMLNRGSVVKDAPLAEMTSTRIGVFEVRVRENAEAFAGAIAGDGWSVRENDSGGLLVSHPDNADPMALFQAAKAQGTHVRHLRPVHKKLEDSFMEALEQH